ncbi:MULTISPECIES: AmmeMemoRadiSam system protein B [Acidithiobacillus]|uniref:MEMO1 family protein DN052_05430 n=3 Tax=root TaxID=1 RepID=A0A2W1KUX2_ACIFR|nr:MULTISPECIES: AmmeMemoRadiSam system protein B [Acidithiobacillus]MBN6747387.1 AmmeMemoRadiSam system protein B [Acidithiobacillus sp. PG05]MCL5957121.1 AmmeMemoRadiSam system protein B [Gammaproteobacteria bacterium]MBN6744868.1 AmmeMemoRadiSam system protein B [Acidithiobacillus sp. MC2.2]MBU2775426.1 AmmeMemoRadiSam system protein B [Acidithiobacillus ferrooxidans]MBU2826267.1 AmmeMemoRadiSam system protein B [Acidithiobacillus ferrooxidans]
MKLVRPAAVAGMFYPGEAAVLRTEVERLLARAEQDGEAASAPWPKAIIVPHAGYIYSGAVAASGYALLAKGRGHIRRVVLLGPAHRLPFRGLALPGVQAMQTPLGTVAVDQAGVEALAGLPEVREMPAAHAQEHALEVQLPFIQEVLGDVSVVPLVVGDARPDEVARVLEKLWGGEETVIVISSDLSHYHPYAEARAIDHHTVEEILRFDPTPIDHEQACGATPINGLLPVARKHHLHPRLVGLCNSGDTAGSRDAVVGYAAVAFYGESHDHTGR